MAKKYLDYDGLLYLWGKLKDYFQVKLVSGTNIKTINSESLLGSGNITISGGSSPVYEKTVFNPTGITSYAGYGGCYYEKYGNVVHVHVGASGLTAGGTDYNIFTLPSGYRPPSNLYAHGTGGSWNNLSYLDIRADGAIHIRSAGNYCGADITYLV